jgi:NAD(P)-dependent dehydrogenase (short-subunit alcohol dehydrogenase family)
MGPQATIDIQSGATLRTKVAIVSGSCSGIGEAIARELAARGAHVVVNYPFPHFETSAKALVESLPTLCIAVEADLSTTTGPGALVRRAVEIFGRVDILVNNAGIAVNLPLEEHNLTHWDKLVNLNGRGTFLLTQEVLPHLPTKEGGGGGRIVNIVSVSSRAPPPHQTIYAGTKGMVESFTRCWAKELPPKYACTVNSVSPGPTQTPAFPEIGSKEFELLEAIFRETPCGARMGQSDEVAHAVAFLCEERSRWINGTNILVTGGLYVD